MDPIERGTRLQQEVESNESLGDFVAQVRNGQAEVIVLHQDSFAADYQETEFILLGKAIKYAGIFGRELRIIGRNRETLTPR
jgi:hypothetical protein